MSTTKEYQKEYYEKNRERLSKQRKLKRLKDKGQHTVASPSALHRLMRCPSSAVLSRYVEDTTSKYAEEGTLFHAVMEYIIKNKLDEKLTDKWIRQYIETNSNISLNKEAIDEMVSCVQDAVDWFNLTYYNAKQIIPETKLPMYYSDKDFGTADVIVIYEDKLVIVDWKYGKGVDVPISYNPQLISYAVSALKYLASNGTDIRKFNNIETVIYQPRIYTEVRVKSYTYSMQELSAEAKRIKEAVDKVYEILGKYKARTNKIVTNNLHASEEACRFCPAKMSCKVYVKQSTDLLDDLIDTKDNTNNEQVDYLTSVGKKFEENLPKLEKFFKELQDYFMGKAETELPDGVYIAQKTPRTVYINDIEKVIEVLRNYGIDVINHDIQLKTITETKKLIKNLENKDEILNEITEKKEGSKYITFIKSECLLDDLKN